jgi:hypothetical protein
MSPTSTGRPGTTWGPTARATGRGAATASRSRCSATSCTPAGVFTSAGGDPNARFAASFPILRPVARIGTHAAGPFVGNNVYSTTAAGQSKTISVARGHSGNLFASFQNDGLRSDHFTIVGTGTATGYTVTYFRGATNVTSQVKNGMYSTGTLAPGGTATLKIVVKLSQGAVNTGSFLVQAKSGPGTSSDAVLAVVKAT